MNDEKVFKIIDIILNEGISGFFKELPKEPDENYCCIMNNDIYVFINGKWEKFSIAKSGMTIWNNATESLWQYFKVGNEWKELNVDLKDK